MNGSATSGGPVYRTLEVEVQTIGSWARAGRAGILASVSQSSAGPISDHRFRLAATLISMRLVAASQIRRSIKSLTITTSV
jgi:hypothetical protein